MRLLHYRCQIPKIHLLFTWSQVLRGQIRRGFASQWQPEREGAALLLTRAKESTSQLTQ